ncbi:MAG TPA: HutD family protein [Alphaproteobacteria bacterium]|nr:HutD family protein [Alphaproteobacteria bacterium]
MAGRILRSSDYQRMPWKNGGGVTAEIWKAVGPDGAMLWRLSIADVASDGPFSAFPGIDRWITVIEGKGMELRIADLGTRRVERQFEPLAFSGDVKTDCRLINGPIRDFNFMVARAHGRGDLQIVALSAGETRSLDPSIAALHVLDGAVELQGTLLATGDSWVAETAAPIVVSTPRPTRLAVMTVQKIGGSGA